MFAPVAGTAPGPTTFYNGGFFGDAPHSANYEWINSTRAPDHWDNNRTNGRYVSDGTFFGNHYVLASYDHFGIYDITNPAAPVFESSTRCDGSQGDVIIQGNLLFVAKEGGHNIPYADLNRACETAAANEVQRAFLFGYKTNGDSFTLNMSGNDTIPIVRGQNNTTAGVVNALMGGNEAQSYALTGYDTDGDSYTINFNGADTVPIVRGQNNTTLGVQTALQGGSEQQQVVLTNNTVNGNSYQLQFGGNNSVAITRGQNNTQAGIQAAIQGGNEQQQVALTGYTTNGASYTLTLGGNTSIPIVRGTNNNATAIRDALIGLDEVQTVGLTGWSSATDTFTINFGGADSAPLGGGTALTNANVKAAIEAIPGWPAGGTVTVTGAADTGFVVTFGGTLAKQDVGALAITNQSAGSNTVTETTKGRAPLHPSLAGATVTVGTVTDGGYTLTFSGAAANTDIGDITVTNPSAGVTGTVRENVKGTAGIAAWPAGGTVTIGTVNDAGYTVTFGGTLANTDVSSLAVVNGTGAPAVTGTVRTNAQGGTGVAGWPAGGTVAVAGLSDNGVTSLTFGGAPFANVDVAALAITNGVGGVTGTVRENAKGSAAPPWWPAGGTVTVASIGAAAVAPSFADSGFTMTFGGTLAATDVTNLTLTNKVNLDDDPESTTSQLSGGSKVQQTSVAAPLASFNGVVIYDVSNPAAPKFVKAVPVCGGGHTITKYFDKKRNRAIIYMTRGSTTGSLAAWGINCAGLPAGRLTAVAVPMDHPKQAYVASESVLTGFAGGGCHDVNVHEEARLITMACPNGPGLSMARLSEDGLSSTTMWTFTWPGLATTHSAAISWDGKLAFVNGEPGGGSGAECAFDDDVVKPMMHILDAQTGRLLGNWALPRPQGTQGTENCTIHVLNMIPIVGRYLMATSFYNGGMAVTDFTNPRAAREIAFMDIPSAPPGTPTDDQSEGCWTGYWYNGNQYCTELSWGFHVWRVNEPYWNDAITVDHLNGQTHDSYIKCKVTFTGGPSRARTAGTVNVNAQLWGAGPLQAAKHVNVRVTAPGFNKVLTTDGNGLASTQVISSGPGQLRVVVPEQVNLLNGCSAPAKSIARKVVRKKR